MAPPTVNQGFNGGPAGGNGGKEGGSNENPQSVDNHKKAPASQEFYRHESTWRSEKEKEKMRDPFVEKSSDDECLTTREVTESFNEHKNVKKVAEVAFKNQDVRKDVQRIKKRLEEGVDPINIGKKSTNLSGSGNIVLIKVKNTRYVVRDNGGGQVEILGIGARGMQALAILIKKKVNFSINIDPI